MDRRLRQLRLQEERAYLQSVARRSGSQEQGSVAGLQTVKWNSARTPGAALGRKPQCTDPAWAGTGWAAQSTGEAPESSGMLENSGAPESSGTPESSRAPESRGVLENSGAPESRGAPESSGTLENSGAPESRGATDQADADGGQRQSRAHPIVPEPLTSDTALQVPPVPMSARDCSLIAGAVQRSAFLRLLGEGQTDALARSFTPARHSPGHLVLAEGTHGDAMYIVAEGELGVTQRGRHLRTLLPGDVFGELAILYDCKRTATVTALTQVRLWAIDRQSYRAIVTSQAKRRRAEILDSLREAPALQGLADARLSKLLDAMEECTFAPGEAIVREGDEGKNFYIILRGEVRVSRSVKGQEEPIRVLRAGDHFGELSLLRNIRRTATCRALGEVTCITLTKEDFQEIGPCCPMPLELSEPEVAGREAPAPAEPGCAPSPEAAPAPRLQDLAAVCYEDGPHQGLPVILGTGGFGRVELVRARDQLFALKRIRKDHVVRRQQQEHVHTEKRVLERSRCPFVVRLFGTYRDNQYVYMLLEFCQGGELWTKLREVRCFEEAVAVFCAACVVEALDYLHGNGVVYRDLKPENLMLDTQGYVKLVDFGFAKELARGEKTYSFCGTPEYLAPEILRHEGHDFAVDFWMLGVLVFEMLAGRPPFHGAEPQLIYSKILGGALCFPAPLSEAACALVSKLCRRRPGQRLGNTSSGIRGIRKHRWFGSVQWKRLALRQIQAPTLALVKQGPPYANFQRLSEDWLPAEEELSGWDEGSERRRAAGRRRSRGAGDGGSERRGAAGRRGAVGPGRGL
ncbi:LOW QUALITY PROTEIN: cGMP-dependent protein kinase 1-like [Pelodiscus sinensis]|uniref:LOW QUALITY PROTEIN: cGMP-dependent protein kinase 1-like n=1 Tax=Pelodiscus sinensis TaxID=13735 RepID=UPI003F6B9257